MSRNKREGRYGGVFKGRHYRTCYCLRHQRQYDEWLISPEGIEWLRELDDFEKSQR